MSYTGHPSVFDRRRDRFYAIAPPRATANQIVSVDTVTGSQATLVADAADVPSVDIGNQLALSALGTYLYIAASSGKLTRLNLVTGQIDQRLDPPGPAGSSRQVIAVLASKTVDQDVYVQYAEITPPAPMPTVTWQYWLTKIEGTTWSQQRLLLQNPETFTIKPDDTEILLYRNGFRKVRIGSNGALAFDGPQSVLPAVPYYPSITPTYVGVGILFKNAVYDATTLLKLYDIPAISCSALANANHAICVGSGWPSHPLFVYDLALRQVLSSWTAAVPPPASGADFAGPTGWVSEAGSNRVLVYVYEGFSEFALYLYEHPSLN